MKALRIHLPSREVSLTDLPTPIPGPGQVRIKVHAAGVCLSDVHFVQGILSPGYLLGDEVTMGHEVAGTIDALGAEVTDRTIGDRVIVIAGVRDHLNRVTTLGFDYDGGFADFVIADNANLVGIPDTLPFEQACIIPDAVSTPWAAISSTAKMQKGESAAVFGIGGLGVHAIQLLAILGVTPIIAIDPMPEARTRALAHGAHFAFDSRHEELKSQVKTATAGQGVNAAFDFAGVPQVRDQALTLLAEEGRLIIVGIAGSPIAITNEMAFVYKRLQIMGHYGSQPHHTDELVEMAKSGQLDLSRSVSEILPLHLGKEALRRLAEKVGNPIRIVLTP